MFAGYAMARRKEKLDQLLYQGYIGDSLQILCRELAGTSIEHRFLELLECQSDKRPTDEKKTSQQIVDEVIEKAGLVVIEA